MVNVAFHHSSVVKILLEREDWSDIKSKVTVGSGCGLWQNVKHVYANILAAEGVGKLEGGYKSFLLVRPRLAKM